MDFRIRENDGKGFFSALIRGKCISFGLFASLFRVIPCSSVANASSLLARSPRIFTAKKLRSSRQVRISCIPLRSLRLRGENALNVLISCNSVANAFSLPTVANASGSDFPSYSV
jgi:hypothetical protein